MTKQVEITNRSGHVLRGIVNIPDEGSRFPAIINVHGFTGNKSGYKNIYTHTARFLAENGFASVRFDLYGNGESDGEFEDMTFTGILCATASGAWTANGSAAPRTMSAPRGWR